MPRAAKTTKTTKTTKTDKVAKTAKVATATKAVKKVKAPKNSGGIEFNNFEPYKPKRGEKYMNEQQRAHFKTILLNWKSDLM